MLKFFQKIIIIASLSLLILPTATLAYREATSGGDLNATVTPDNPGPQEAVKVNLQAYGFDIDNSLISWTKDGKLANSGIGLKNFSFQTGALGQRTVIGIEVIPRTQNYSVKKVLVFEPMDIDLEWQAGTNIPYWYQGRSLAGAESQILVSAISKVVDINGQTIAPENLIYKWTKDGKALDGQSGVGQSNLVFTAGKKGVNQIGLTVVTPNGSSQTKTLVIPIQDPQIAFYQEAPLLGTIFQQQIGGDKTISSGLSLRAETFGFSNDGLNYRWSVQQEAIPNNSADPGLVYFDLKTNNLEPSKVELSIDNPIKIFQSAIGSLFLNSDAKQSLF
jgi:hypothetical protein